MNKNAGTDKVLEDPTYYLLFNFEIIYSPGNYNFKVDSVSRNRILEPYENQHDIIKILNIIELKNIQNDEERNQNINRIIRDWN